MYTILHGNVARALCRHVRLGFDFRLDSVAKLLIHMDRLASAACTEAACYRMEPGPSSVGRRSLADTGCVRENVGYWIVDPSNTTERERSMKSLFVLLSFVAVGAAVVLSQQSNSEPAAEDDQKMLVHGVYFTLTDKSDEAKEEFIGLCEQYLTGHEGTAHFAVGARGEEFNREVNDQDFDIGLYVVFESKAAHDKYQEHPRHLEFIAKGREKWESVRVFDSYVAASRPE